MARAYIVLARNDLDDSLLQVLDLKPNATPSKGSRIYDGAPQGGYQTFFYADGVNGDVVTAGAGPITIDGDVYGLSAYLIDHVENTGSAGEALTAAEANNIRDAILGEVALGNALTLADINALIVAEIGAGNDLDGTLGNSTGSVEEVLRILAGERYKMPDATQVEDGGKLFTQAVGGFFVARPNVEVPDSARTSYGTARGLRGRKSTSPLTHVRAGEPRAGQAPVQTGQEDVNFNDVRVTVDTGDLHLSSASGVLDELNNATFVFLNPSFTYNGGIAPATDAAGANLPATGAGRAVTVYDAAGNVI